jgi:AmmeMemoRadiSam system protein B
MTPEPNEPPPRPGRIVIPGAAPEPEESASPRIVSPSGGAPESDAPPAPRIVLPSGGAPEPEGPAAPRIVLPPGVSREEAEDVPEYPRLRPLVLVPVSDGKREVLLVSDPLGVIRGQPALGVESIAILQLLDGSVSLTDITAALMRETRDLRIANMVRDFVARLDAMLMLDSPRFEAAYSQIRDAYRTLEIRQSAFDGRSYPAEREALAAFLDEHFAAAERLRDAGAGVDAAAGQGEAAAGFPAGARVAAGNAAQRPRALLAPHLDPRRAGPAIARAYLELDRASAEPLRVVVFGTGHTLMEERVALTRKHYETPLGKVPTDTAFVDALISRLGEAATRAEIAHRDEHSIEFQALYLKHRFGIRPLTMVPILCGGFHGLLEQGRTPREDPLFESLIAAVGEAEAALGGETVYVAGADLSHVGPRFGDPPMDARAKEEIEAIDREALAAAAKGDADGWFASIAQHEDSSRICGYAPVYATLRCTGPREGRLLHYEQSDEKDSSMVTIASMAW